MSTISYPIERETFRLRRWLETAGASPRIVSGLAGSAGLRNEIDGIIAGSLRMIPVDMSAGELIPDAFRLYRGSHTSYTLFRFSGLAARVAREGTAPILALERDEALFRRPATWAFLWLEEPALWPLLNRLAPRLSALIELHPTFPDPALFELNPDSASLAQLSTTIHAGKRTAIAPGTAARTLIARGDLPSARRLLDERAFAVGDFLMARAELDCANGDPQSALAHFAAAAAAGDRSRPLALIRAAELLERLGEHDGAATLAGESLASGEHAEARVRSALLSGRLGMTSPSEAAGNAETAAGDDPELLALLAKHTKFGHERELRLQKAIAAADSDPVLQSSLRADLGEELAREYPRVKDATALLEPLVSRDDEAGLRARRGLIRLALATRETDRSRFEQAITELETLLAEANQRGYVREAIACLWDQSAFAAAAEDLTGVLAALDGARQTARKAGLREIEFEALDQHTRALRLGRQLALASGGIDELEALAKDMTLPELELRALTARGDHARELGAIGECHTAYERAAGIAEALGDSALAFDLRSRING